MARYGAVGRVDHRFKYIIKIPLLRAGSHKDVAILLVGTGVPDGPRHILLRSKQIFNPDKFATKSVGVHY